MLDGVDGVRVKAELVRRPRRQLSAVLSSGSEKRWHGIAWLFGIAGACCSVSGCNAMVIHSVKHRLMQSCLDRELQLRFGGEGLAFPISLEPDGDSAAYSQRCWF